MASRGDFHLHSTASDGILSPTELVDLAYKHGVRVMALTDHDSTEGVAEARAAAARHGDLTLIPGVEMGTDVPGGEVHVLGYYLEPENAELQATLAKLREGRKGRGFGMVEKLNELGFAVTWEQVQRIAGDASVGRPHVAQALLEKGYVGDIKEAFDKYIGRNGPAYVEREKMTPSEAVATIVRLGGVACLAHPTDFGGREEGAPKPIDLDALLAELKAAGLAGVEAYYKNYPPETVERIKAAAKKHGLIAWGGTDYHGIHGPDEPFPGQMRSALPEESIEALLALGRERTRSAK
jgi:predicted metal-dependent phosphoesterase TrpH